MKKAILSSMLVFGAMNASAQLTVYHNGNVNIGSEQPTSNVSLSVGNVHFLRNVIIDPNIQWTVGGNLYFHNGAKLIVSNKASLKIVDNAVIDDVTLCVAKESSLDVQDGSEIRLRSGSNLFLPRGCSATLKDGTIKNMK